MTALARRLERPLRAASHRHFQALRPHLRGASVLDVGCAEGWIAERIQREAGMRATLLDVVDLNRTGLPHRVYDGRTIPWADGAFDTVLVMLALHHCADPDRVLAEAARVARLRIIVSESVYRTPAGRWMLWAMDTAVNAARSGRLMPEAAQFRRVHEWRGAFRRLGLRLASEQWLSFGVHRHVQFALDKEPDR